MVTKKHNFTATELKAGVMVIVSGVVFAIFLAVITGMRPPADVNTFYAYFDDTAGLNRGADVRFGGKKVGRVMALELDPEDQSRIRVAFSVPVAVPVNADSEVFVTQTTLTAEKHLAATTGAKGASRLEDGAVVPSRAGDLFDHADKIAQSVQDVLDDVETLIGVKRSAKEEDGEAAGASEGEAEDASDEGKDEETATIAEIVAGAEDTVDEATDLLKDLRDVVGESRGDIEDIFAKVEEIEDSAKKLVEDVNGIVADNRGDIRETVAGVKDTVDGAGKSVEQVSAILERVDGLSENLGSIAEALQATLDNAEALSGNGRDFVEGARPDLEDIILDVRTTVGYLKDFARTISEQPESVLRGSTAQGRRHR